MKIFLIIGALILSVAAYPEAPNGRYGPPPPSSPPALPQQNYGPPAPQKYLPPDAPKKQYGPPATLPAVEPQKQYGPPPPQPQKEYGPPAPEYGPPAPEYGPPAQEYGPPQQEQKLITKNVYVHIPPPENEEIIPSQVFDVPVPKKHYKIIFIKAPTPPTPTAPIIPEQPQDEHKTLVYVLVKKPEPQPLIEIPKPAPTEPSKPEVYFIKYKDGGKTHVQYGPPPPRGPY